MGIDGTVLFAITPPRITKYFNGSGTHNMHPLTLYAFIELLGGGASGIGGGLTPPAGNHGTQSTFDTLVAGPGLTPASQIIGGIGGNPNGGTGWTLIRSIYGSGGNSGSSQLITFAAASGKGGDSFFNGGGASSASGAVGGNAALNSGSGGAGGSANSGVAAFTGAGGGSSAYLKAIGYGIAGMTFSYSVGQGGASTAGGTNGSASGSGGSGMVIVHECFQ